MAGVDEAALRVSAMRRRPQAVALSAADGSDKQFDGVIHRACR